MAFLDPKYPVKIAPTFATQNGAILVSAMINIWWNVWLRLHKNDLLIRSIF